MTPGGIFQLLEMIVYYGYFQGEPTTARQAGFNGALCQAWNYLFHSAFSHAYKGHMNLTTNPLVWQNPLCFLNYLRERFKPPINRRQHTHFSTPSA